MRRTVAAPQGGPAASVLETIQDGSVHAVVNRFPPTGNKAVSLRGDLFVSGDNEGNVSAKRFNANG